MDTATNPYLGMAVILASGLDGVENELPLIDSINANLFELSKKEREALGVENLPDNLKEAIDVMQEDPLIKSALGDHIYTKFIELKTKEWDDFKTCVTQWELKRYMKII